MVMDMTVKKMLVVYDVSILITIFVLVIIYKSHIIDFSAIDNNGAKDFHNNVLTFSTVIAGFLFTNVGILISSVSNERVGRLFEHGYLDNLYRSAFTGIAGNVIAFLLAWIEISFILSDVARLFVLKIEFGSIIVGIIYFIWSCVMVYGVVTDLKKQR